MKVSVNFGQLSVVVPCGDGNITISQLAQRSLQKYLKLSVTTLNGHCDNEFGPCPTIKQLTSLQGSLYDMDDLVSDVLDNNEQIIAILSNTTSPFNLEKNIVINKTSISPLKQNVLASNGESNKTFNGTLDNVLNHNINANKFYDDNQPNGRTNNFNDSSNKNNFNHNNFLDITGSQHSAENTLSSTISSFSHISNLSSVLQENTPINKNNSIYKDTINNNNSTIHEPIYSQINVSTKKHHNNGNGNVTTITHQNSSNIVSNIECRSASLDDNYNNYNEESNQQPLIEDEIYDFPSFKSEIDILEDDSNCIDESSLPFNININNDNGNNFDADYKNFDQIICNDEYTMRNGGDLNINNNNNNSYNVNGYIIPAELCDSQNTLENDNGNSNNNYDIKPLKLRRFSEPGMLTRLRRHFLSPILHDNTKTQTTLRFVPRNSNDKNDETVLSDNMMNWENANLLYSPTNSCNGEKFNLHTNKEYVKKRSNSLFHLDDDDGDNNDTIKTIKSPNNINLNFYKTLCDIMYGGNDKKGSKIEKLDGKNNFNVCKNDIYEVRIENTNPESNGGHTLGLHVFSAFPFGLLVGKIESDGWLATKLSTTPILKVHYKDTEMGNIASDTGLFGSVKNRKLQHELNYSHSIIENGDDSNNLKGLNNYNATLESGDVIIEVNGQNLKDLTYDKCLNIFHKSMLSNTLNIKFIKQSTLNKDHPNLFSLKHTCFNSTVTTNGLNSNNSINNTYTAPSYQLYPLETIVICLKSNNVDKNININLNNMIDWFTKSLEIVKIGDDGIQNVASLHNILKSYGYLSNSTIDITSIVKFVVKSNNNNNNNNSVYNEYAENFEMTQRPKHGDIILKINNVLLLNAESLNDIKNRIFSAFSPTNDCNITSTHYANEISDSENINDANKCILQLLVIRSNDPNHGYSYNYNNNLADNPIQSICSGNFVLKNPQNLNYKNEIVSETNESKSTSVIYTFRIPLYKYDNNDKNNNTEMPNTKLQKINDAQNMDIQRFTSLGLSVKGKTTTNNNMTVLNETLTLNGLCLPGINDKNNDDDGEKVKKAQKKPNVGQDLGIFIKSVLPDGAAFHDGRLLVNDQIIAINEQKLTQCDNLSAMNMLKAIMKDIFETNAVAKTTQEISSPTKLSDDFVDITIMRNVNRQSTITQFDLSPCITQSKNTVLLKPNANLSLYSNKNKTNFIANNNTKYELGTQKKYFKKKDNNIISNKTVFFPTKLRRANSLNSLLFHYGTNGKKSNTPLNLNTTSETGNNLNSNKSVHKRRLIKAYKPVRGGESHKQPTKQKKGFNSFFQTPKSRRSSCHNILAPNVGIKSSSNPINTPLSTTTSIEVKKSRRTNLCKNESFRAALGHVTPPQNVKMNNILNGSTYSEAHRDINILTGTNSLPKRENHVKNTKDINDFVLPQENLYSDSTYLFAQKAAKSESRELKTTVLNLNKPLLSQTNYVMSNDINDQLQPIYSPLWSVLRSSSKKTKNENKKASLKSNKTTNSQPNNNLYNKNGNSEGFYEECIYVNRESVQQHFLHKKSNKTEDKTENGDIYDCNQQPSQTTNRFKLKASLSQVFRKMKFPVEPPSLANGNTKIHKQLSKSSTTFDFRGQRNGSLPKLTLKQNAANHKSPKVDNNHKENQDVDTIYSNSLFVNSPNKNGSLNRNKEYTYAKLNGNNSEDKNNYVSNSNNIQFLGKRTLTRSIESIYTPTGDVINNNLETKIIDNISAETNKNGSYNKAKNSDHKITNNKPSNQNSETLEHHVTSKKRPLSAFLLDAIGTQ